MFPGTFCCGKAQPGHGDFRHGSRQNVSLWRVYQLPIRNASNNPGAVDHDSRQIELMVHFTF
ncbi:MAG TPA: hypothetical protein VG498_13125 [Terriglobales bacterium]|nr:hypothetical protein [Terriglobales bacterium]